MKFQIYTKESIKKEIWDFIIEHGIPFQDLMVIIDHPELFNNLLNEPNYYCYYLFNGYGMLVLPEGKTNEELRDLAHDVYKNEYYKHDNTNLSYWKSVAEEHRELSEKINFYKGLPLKYFNDIKGIIDVLEKKYNKISRQLSFANSIFFR